MLTQSIAALLPLLTLLSSPVAAGVVAFFAFDAARRRYPQPQELPASSARRLLLWLLYAPLGARLATSALAIGIALICGSLVAWASGGDVVSAADAILAAFVGPFVASLMHGLRHLSRELPEPAIPPAARQAGIYETLRAQIELDRERR